MGIRILDVHCLRVSGVVICRDFDGYGNKTRCLSRRRNVERNHFEVIRGYMSVVGTSWSCVLAFARIWKTNHRLRAEDPSLGKLKKKGAGRHNIRLAHRPLASRHQRHDSAKILKVPQARARSD